MARTNASTKFNEDFTEANNTNISLHFLWPQLLLFRSPRHEASDISCSLARCVRHFSSCVYRVWFEQDPRRARTRRCGFPTNRQNERRWCILLLGPILRDNQCGDSTFVNQGSEASPWISDCETIVRNIAGGGTWTLFDGYQRTLATYGTCAFGAQKVSGGSSVHYVGNEDIRDLITDSIRKFGRNDGKIGAKGRMGCNAPGNSSAIEWGIYHT